MFRPIIFTLLLTVISISVVSAQTEKSDSDLTEEMNPILRTLDSLDNIDPIYRYKNILISNQLSNDSANSNLIPTFSDAEYQQKVNSIVSPIRIDYNPTIRNFIDVYAKHSREHTAKIIGLSDMYFPMIEELLDKEGLPLELKYLAIVESALNPNAVSRSGATGLWQFMYNTGRAYDLQIDSYVDERRDPYKSTLAAIEYFKDMYRKYGDWHLVIASYNCGPGNVNKAIRRSGGETDFWKIKNNLPRETRGYLPAFMAVTYLFNHLEDHNMYVIEAPFTYFELDTIMLDKSVSFNKIAEEVDLPKDVVAYLNPSYKKGIIPNTEHANKLVLPNEKIAVFEEKKSDIFSGNAYNEMATVTYQKKKIYHKVRSGENLSVIAYRNKCSVSDLKKWNGLSGTNLRIGQSLLVYTLVPVTSENVASVEVEEIDNNKYLYYTVQEGDTLWDIANRHNDVSVKELLQINNIYNSRRLKPGTKIKIKTTG
ncbi:MAG: LysM peptidoglycan-binding domain-containing protein [Bacteroidia bacterium]|nr:LysM peptidoglycan-binding domain-containing protein [Bacteroidia bacterium]NNC84780.1 LysM peptidoglycan-binding domain-containing protein [Bacteroidia bacterium]NNM15093.1 LysM peptidoglycan-binding domain-containing protein [Bacteroidia bacterium]